MIDVVKKLRFAGHEKVLVLNTPGECSGILKELKKLTELHIDIDKKTKYTAALAFVEMSNDLKKSGPAITRQLAEDAVFWLAYPKKTSKKYKSDITRDHGWQVIGDAGYETVASIAIDEDWSALRFRKPENIKSMIRRQEMVMTDPGKKKTLNKSDKAISPAVKK